MTGPRQTPPAEGTELQRHAEGGARVQQDLDPGAYLGQRPELAADRIPGGLQPDDERVAAHDAARGAPGEPDAPIDDQPRTGDARDAVEGEIGAARLREPGDLEREQTSTAEPGRDR